MPNRAPFGMVKAPPSKSASIWRTLRARLIVWIAGDMSVMINCSTSDDVHVSLKGEIGPVVIENVRLGLPELRANLRMAIHMTNEKAKGPLSGL